MSVYAYLRVSTGKQDSDNQRLGIEALAKKLDLSIDEWIDDEGVSGTKEPEKRELGKLLAKLKDGDVLLAGEISRIGRNLFMIMRILEHCMKSNVRVFTAKDGYELGDNIQSKVLAFAFGLAAEIERNMISMRTKEALARLKMEGKFRGKEFGKRCRLNPICEKNRELILREINSSCDNKNKGRKSLLAKQLGVSKGTLYRYLTYIGAHNPQTIEGSANHKRWERGIFH